MLLYYKTKNNASPYINMVKTERTAYLCCTPLLSFYGMQYSPDTATQSL